MNKAKKTAGNIGHNSQGAALSMLDKLHTQQVEWRDTLYKSANDRLLGLLSECLEAYKLLKDDKIACKVVNARLTDLGLGAREGTHLTMRVVRYVFRITNSRAAAYARVLRAAMDHKIDPMGLKEWVIGLGGVEAVRRLSKSSVSPAEIAKQVREDAGKVLGSVKALASIAKLPMALKPGEAAYEGFKLVLMRHNKQTGEGEIVWASDNAALTRRFLAVVGTDVIAKNKKYKAQNTASDRRALRAVAIAAPVAANKKVPDNVAA